jgi:GntR family transcriptional repressor for pyruvate dehydrogenase complex
MALVAPKRKTDVTATLLDRFKHLIAERVFTPGCKLLPERVLAKRFGVSRGSLRHALKVLENMGVLVQKVGDGTYLNSDTSAILAQPLEFLILMGGISTDEIYEARLIVEPPAAAKAAEAATPEHLMALHRALTVMQADSCGLAEYAVNDLAFHKTILQASGNVVCESMFVVLHRFILNNMLRTNALVPHEQGNNQHEAIYTAIRERRASEAHRRMTEHLQSARVAFARLNRSRSEAALAERITQLSRPFLPGGEWKTTSLR